VCHPVCGGGRRRPCPGAEKAVVAHCGCLAGPRDEQAAGSQDALPGQFPGAGPATAPPVPDGLRDVAGRERALVSRGAWHPRDPRSVSDSTIGFR
jgi:hypothetical protein